MKSSLDAIRTRIPILDLKRQFSILSDDSVDESIRLLVIFTFAFSLFYFVSPFDVIPDVLLGYGYLDDLTIYGALREVAYVGSEKNYGIKQAIVETFKSRIIWIALSVILSLIIVVVLGYILLHLII